MKRKEDPLDTLAQDCDRIIKSKNANEIKKQIEICKSALNNYSVKVEIGKIYYFIGNLYQVLPSQSINTLNAFREALKLTPATVDIFAHIKTNEANELLKLGRNIEALTIFDIYSSQVQLSEAKIISLIHGIDTICELAQLVRKKDISDFYYVKALILKKNLSAILERPTLDQYFHGVINSYLSRLLLTMGEAFTDAENALEDKGEPIPDKAEHNYRNWCLNNVLFLNHMNDLTKSFFDMSDTVTFPDYITKCFKSPHYSIAFSSIKRDYCFARFLAYEGIFETYPKFEEGGLNLADDYLSNFSGKAERLKSAFRLAFGVFDKISTFIANYFPVEQEIKRPMFKPSFFEHNFDGASQKNKFLRAMYYVSCDLDDTSKNNDPRLLADAKHLKDTRNNLEHNWLRVSEVDEGKCCDDDYSSVITTERLEADTIKLLKLARACLMYLKFAVQIEEDERQQIDKAIGLDVPLWNSQSENDEIV